jgi:putative acetyltransferase
MSTIRIRRATANDLESILQLFQQTIEAVNAKDYSPGQIAVWKNGAAKKERWIEKIATQYFLLAEIKNETAGFGSITQEGYLDFLYVSKDHQRMGVAAGLYHALEQFALSNHLPKIISDVSITARPFFEKQGYIVVQQQSVVIDGVSLTNYKMEKHLTVNSRP